MTATTIWTSVRKKLIVPVKLTPSHQLNLPSSDKPMQNHRCNLQCRWNQVRKLNSTGLTDVPKTCIGVFTVLLLKEHVKGVGRESSAPVKPTMHQSEVSVQYQVSSRELRLKFEDRLNRQQGIGLTNRC